MVPKRKIALVIEDFKRRGEAVRSMLIRDFKEVYVTHSPSEAQRIMDEEPVTHILSESNLGIQCSGLDAFEIVSMWRQSHSSIERIVMLSNQSEGFEKPEDVDVLLSVGSPTQRIVEALVGNFPLDSEKDDGE